METDDRRSKTETELIDLYAIDLCEQEMSQLMK